MGTDVLDGGIGPSTYTNMVAGRAGLTFAEVQSTLGHANVATTSGYLHSRPNTSSGLKLDEGIFR